jgi:hypothetical protein
MFGRRRLALQVDCDRWFWLAAVAFAYGVGRLTGDARGYARGVHRTAEWIGDVRAPIILERPWLREASRGAWRGRQ